MEKHELSDLQIDWVSLIRQVARDQVPIEIADGTPNAIVEVVPKKPPILVKDLPALMALLPSLGEDAVTFAEDVEQGRLCFGEDSDPWAS
jgi:hypothetical protein